MAYVKHNDDTGMWEVIVIGSDTLEFTEKDEAEGFAEFVNGDE